MVSRKQYTREFKLEALDLARHSDKSDAEIERNLGLSQGRLSAWKRHLAQAGAEAFPGTGHLTDSEAEMHRLRRENELLRQERDILKKAVAIFSMDPKP